MFNVRPFYIFSDISNGHCRQTLELFLYSYLHLNKNAKAKTIAVFHAMHFLFYMHLYLPFYVDDINRKYFSIPTSVNRSSNYC